MELAQRQNLTGAYSLGFVKSFLIWSFTLTVCLLVVGFPLVVLMVTVGCLAALVLQSVLPMSAVLLVAGSLVGGNVLLILLSAAILTIKGAHPQQVRWLHWLHGEPSPLKAPIFAACPLTCELPH